MHRRFGAIAPSVAARPGLKLASRSWLNDTSSDVPGAKSSAWAIELRPSFVREPEGERRRRAPSSEPSHRMMLTVTMQTSLRCHRRETGARRATVELARGTTTTTCAQDARAQLRAGVALPPSPEREPIPSPRSISAPIQRTDLERGIIGRLHQAPCRTSKPAPSVQRARSLPRADPIVGRCDPVTAEIALPFPVFGVGAQSFSPTLVDLVLVGRQVTALPRKLSLAIFRIFGISLSLPNGFGGNHRCFPLPIHR